MLLKEMACARRSHPAKRGAGAGGATQSGSATHPHTVYVYADHLWEYRLPRALWAGV